MLILGAGLSGIGAACHLQRQCPRKSYAILEAREAIGGTWDLFRYPGIRSDSDMFTFGYSFRPWTAPESIADGPSILRYIRDTAERNARDEKIRFGHRALRADGPRGSALDGDGANAASGETVRLTCNFLPGCTGYSATTRASRPAFEGPSVSAADHPSAALARGLRGRRQTDRRDRQRRDRRHARARAGRAGAQVTMLQRSPSYILSLPGKDPLATALRRFSARRTYSIVRWKNVLLSSLVFGSAGARRNRGRADPAPREQPASRGLRRRHPLPPRYKPWDQRLCLVPDGDLFKAISAGNAEIVTDAVKSFTEHGVCARLRQGARGRHHRHRHRPQRARPRRHDARRGRQPTSTWRDRRLQGHDALRRPERRAHARLHERLVDAQGRLVAQYVCRLLKTMDRRGTPICAAQPPDPRLPRDPIIDLKSGYVLRASGAPQAGSIDALAPSPELHPRRLPAQARLARRRDGVLHPSRATSRASGRRRRAGRGGLARDIVSDPSTQKGSPAPEPAESAVNGGVTNGAPPSESDAGMNVKNGSDAANDGAAHANGAAPPRTVRDGAPARARGCPMALQTLAMRTRQRPFMERARGASTAR